MFIRYGMDRHTIKKVQKQIEAGKTKEAVCAELKISFGQFGFVNDVIVSGKKPNINTQLKAFSEISTGDRLECADPDYGLGTVMQIYSDEDLMSVKFDKRKLATMCSIKHKSTVHDTKKRKLTMLTVSAY